MSETNVNVYVLDTSVLIHDPDAMYKFKNNYVVIPIWVLEELDNNKNSPVSGADARAASRKLDELMSRGSFRDGIVTKDGGTVIVDYGSDDMFESLPIHLEKINDNRIILVALKWQRHNGKKVTLLSNDINMRIKANALGIRTKSYNDRKISGSDLYSGFIEMDVDRGFISRLYSSDVKIDATDLAEEHNLIPNQCCLFKDPGGKYALGIFKKKKNTFKIVKKPEQWQKEKDKKGWSVVPKNIGQAFFHALLNDPEILLVTGVGRAGTGKTLISLLAGNNQLNNRYNAMTIFRPTSEAGDPMGFLPGDMDEKFAPWKVPVMDNLKLVVGNDTFEDKDGDDHYYQGKQHTLTPARALIESGVIEISPINYLLGRSIHNSFIIVDESQNFSKQQMQTIITRAGHGSKMVLVGDPRQIYNRFLGPLSNGLIDVAESFKGQEIFGHIILTKGERSYLAELATELL